MPKAYHLQKFCKVQFIIIAMISSQNYVLTQCQSSERIHKMALHFFYTADV